MIYHLALIKGTGKTRYWSNGHRATTCVLQARRNIDFLSTDVWKYLGTGDTTKAELKRKVDKLLPQINACFGTRFTRLIID